MSAIGMANNTNTEGFSFMDMMNFTGELSRMMKGGNGNVNINITSDDPNAAMLGGNNSGIRTIWGGGLNYNNIIGSKIDFTSNYFYNHYNPKTASQYCSGNIFCPTRLISIIKTRLAIILITATGLTLALTMSSILFIH